MKILFSPSEAKRAGGKERPFDQNSFIFPELYEKRKEILDRYNTIIQTSSDEKLSKLFGIKNPSKFIKYRQNIYLQPTMKAVERYTGVAFDYLNYQTLTDQEQHYIDQNTMIFSNLFGAILAGDSSLPEYKLKQGEKLDNLATETFYKKHFSTMIDSWIGDEPFLDLRAGFYNKFYKTNTKHYTTLKFLKNGKVVSHWAKAYRGLVLRSLSQNNVKNMDDFMNMEIEKLEINEIIQIKNMTQINFNIIG